MKLLIILLFIFSTAFAVKVPFAIPEVQDKFEALDTSIATNVTDITALETKNTQTADGNLVKQVKRATWEVAVDGGAKGAINLGITIPANALINFVYFYIVSQGVSSGNGTGALHCEDANNLYSAADFGGFTAGTVTLGVPQNAAANMVKSIAANCSLTWTIASAAYTAGKIIFFVEYTVIDVTN